MGHREPLKSGDEQDAFSGWRKLLCVFKRPGVARKTKTRFSRRVRHEVKASLRSNPDGWL
jgi:hypothetical protein